MAAFHSSLGLSEILSRLHDEVSENHALAYSERETTVQHILGIDSSSTNAEGRDILHLLVAIGERVTAGERVHQEDIAKILTYVEPYSRLFPDIILSPALPTLLAHPMIRQSSLIAEPLLSMLKISIKLNLSRQDMIPVSHQQAVVDYSLSLLCLDENDGHVKALTVAETARSLLEVLIPWNYAVHLVSLHRYTMMTLAAHGPSSRSGATILLRYLSLACHLAVHDKTNTAFPLCVEVGLITQILHFVRFTDDILLQFNAMELVSQLTSCSSGLHYLCQPSTGIITWLIDITCGGTESHPVPNDLIASEALRVLGTLFESASHHSYQLIEHIGTNTIQHFLDTVHSHLEDGDEVTRINGK